MHNKISVQGSSKTWYTKITDQTHRKVYKLICTGKFVVIFCKLAPLYKSQKL